MKITELLQRKTLSLSFEVFPPKTESRFDSVQQATEAIARLKPAFMSVTYGAGGGTSRYTLDIAKTIHEQHGVPTLAHLTCVSSTKETVREKIAQMRAAGITNVMALRGDIPAELEGADRSGWDYRYAIDLVRELKATDADFCIGGACYPEVHPESADQQSDIRYLKEKVEAGCDFLTTQMFFDNNLLYNFLYKIREARRQCRRPGEKWVALDVGPSGKLLRPLGDLDFEDAVALFAETVRLGVKYGADLIVIETMNDSYETKAALLAAKENSALPVVVTNAYGEDGKLMTGATPAAMVAMLEGMGADAVGANCSLGPRQLRGVAEELLRVASVPVVMKPNAGLPRSVNGATVFDVTAEEFADEMEQLVRAGVRVAGGCCGTTPRYIEELAARMAAVEPVPLTDKKRTVVASYTHAVAFGREPVLIGERINPTGKKRFRQALVEQDMDYVLNEGLRQQEAGAQVLDVNVGLPEIDEAAVLRRVVCELQAVSDLPLQVDTSDPVAMEAALRRINGKALVNSVNGKAESMAAVFPLVKKYGGTVIALTLDEQGIPATAEGRVAIARRIVDTAAQYGIAKHDIVFDTLAMAVSADPTAAAVTLEALRRIRQELGCHTSLGVSNISFGLPARDVITGTFFTLALANGLSAAIMNPYSADMQRAVAAYRALMGLDTNCENYIAAAAGFASVAAATAPAATGKAEEASGSALQQAIVKGLQDRAGALTAALLAEKEPLAVVNEEIIPALNRVGEGYENKTVYLPQLLMSAEAAKSAFECIKSRMATGDQAAARGPIVIATVHGDIHDIGKNIVKLLLENYGFAVLDLGRDVPPETVVQAVTEHHAPLAGLSALMTTTVPAMEETIRQLRAAAPWCRVVVGGAVLTQEYADSIGADKYAKDAMETVRYAETVCE